MHLLCTYLRLHFNDPEHPACRRIVYFLRKTVVRWKTENDVNHLKEIRNWYKRTCLGFVNNSFICVYITSVDYGIIFSEVLEDVSVTFSCENKFVNRDTYIYQIIHAVWYSVLNHVK